MAHRTDQPPAQHSPEPPRENPIFRQPATVATCRADYEAAADIRARLDQQIKARR
ncbi:hypothetical protein [Streptomyces phaeolivaceus]|uniref:hypothetical protein n=1 Tax=Streptomyces phaeolivaceus TaxID=2653200 RepID=UPI00186A4EE0|nr:hypothetical protein [Streptomyces phaeolivaceus]